MKKNQINQSFNAIKEETLNFSDNKDKSHTVISVKSKGG